MASPRLSLIRTYCRARPVVINNRFYRTSIYASERIQSSDDKKSARRAPLHSTPLHTYLFEPPPQTRVPKARIIAFSIPQTSIISCSRILRLHNLLLHLPNHRPRHQPEGNHRTREKKDPIRNLKGAFSDLNIGLWAVVRQWNVPDALVK